MSTIKKVALAGATGNLGPSILDQLVKANFTVTALTRHSSTSTNTHTFPPSVTVTPVDYDSLPSLTAALQHHDAVVSTLASVAVSTQLLLVAAAAQAGVKRFIPSEFGCDTLNEKVRAIPIFKSKIEVQDALVKEAGKPDGGMSYTLVCTGPFFDWGIRAGFFINLREKSIGLYDGGGRPFSTTTLATIGKAVVGVLTHLSETANRAVYVQDTAITQTRLLEMGKKATGGGGEGWKEDVVKTEDELAAAWAEIKKERPDQGRMIMGFLRAACWGEGCGGAFERVDNEVLGLGEMGEGEVERVVEGLAA